MDNLNAQAEEGAERRPIRRRQDEELVPIRTMRQAFSRANVWIAAAREAGHAAGYDSDEDEPISPTQRYLDDNDAWKEVTNFTRDEVIQIWRPFNDRMAAERHRGPAPESNPMDHLIHYLAWLNSNIDYGTLSKMLGVKESRYEDNLGRARGYLFETLSQRWWVNRRRPQFSNGTRFPMVGLIVDGFTTEISPPKMNFKDAMTYWDGKNKIYGLKSEVAVSGTVPHYCLFLSDHMPGSVHDYLLHKQHFHNYGEYLHVTAEEDRQINHDPARQYWAVMGDKGYIGDPQDTYPITRIIPVKNAILPQDVRYNEEHKTRRVVVEQFLGRLCRLWSVFAQTWRYDWTHFDIDLHNACMLSNEHIANHVLVEEDAEIYRGIEQLRLEKAAQARTRRLEAVANSRRRKQRRLDAINEHENRADRLNRH